jgi:hypothetical protein
LNGKGKEQMDAFFAHFENHHDRENEPALRVTNPEVRSIISEFCLLPIHDVTIPMYIREMSVVYMVILFENFLTHLLRASFGMQQELLRSYSNKTMSFPELLDCIQNGRIGSSMIQKVVDEIMRQCIDDIVDKHLDKRLGSSFHMILCSFTVIKHRLAMYSARTACLGP